MATGVGGLWNLVGSAIASSKEHKMKPLHESIWERVFGRELDKRLDREALVDLRHGVLPERLTALALVDSFSGEMAIHNSTAGGGGAGGLIAISSLVPPHFQEMAP